MRTAARAHAHAHAPNSHRGTVCAVAHACVAIGGEYTSVLGATAMRLFFVNTDAVSSGGQSRHDEWLRRNVALTSGGTKYRDQLQRVPPRARVLVYVNGVGVVAVGETISGEVLDVTPPETVSPAEPVEYHRPVSWLLDLRDSPITHSELTTLLGQGPRRAVQEVVANRDKLLHRLALMEAAAPTSDVATYLRVASELRRFGQMPKPIGIPNPVSVVTQSTQYKRDPEVRAWTLQRAQGRCELCSEQAPFVDEYNNPYLESHHMDLLAERGADTPENTAALCANCHRELHFGADRRIKTEKLRQIVAVKEASTDAGPKAAAA